MAERTLQQLGKERAVWTPEKVKQWFDGYRAYITDEVKDPSLFYDQTRIYNADESGFSLCPRSGKVVAQKASSNVYNFTSSDKTQITVFACMSGSGHILPSMIAYPGQRFLQNPLEGFPDAVLGRSENGWMDSELFLTWLRDVFIPSVDQRGVKKPIVLYVDGHSTHLNLDVSEMCKAYNILLYCLLEQASHLIRAAV